MKNAIVYLHSSETMSEIKDKSVDLLIGASVYLTGKDGKQADWEEYRKLYKKVYIDEGLRILKPDGVFLVIQTNSYTKGKFLCKYVHLMSLLEGHYAMIDERVWEKNKSNDYQVPFSHVLVFRPEGGTRTRRDMNRRSKQWFRGVWNFPQNRSGITTAHNAWPMDMCRMIIEACTDKGNMIVDPFAGTGLLLSTAVSMGREAIGFEINKELIPVLQKNGNKVVVDGELVEKSGGCLL